MDRSLLECLSADDLSVMLRRLEEAEAAVKADKAAVVAEASRRGVWRGDGADNLAAWVAAHSSMSARSARELTSTARRLHDRPTIAKALADGRLSWDQVVPLARLSTTDDEAYWASEAEAFTPEQLWAHHRRQLDENRPDTPERETLKWRRDDHSGALKYWGTALGDNAEAILAAIARTIEDEVRPAAGEEPVPYDTQAAHALALLARTTIDDTSRSARATVNVHVPADLLQGAFGQPVLALADTPISHAMFDRLCCDGAIRLIFDGRDGSPTAWTEARRPPPPLDAAVRRRDIHCIWPGCRRRVGQVHHIVWWSKGGPTTYQNLVLLCWYHHRKVHEGGWKMTGTAGNVTIQRPNGTILATGIGPPTPLAS